MTCDAIQEQVLAQARLDIEWMSMDFQNYADHTMRPDCLGYAIRNRLLTDDEMSSVRYNHGETLETFPEIHTPKNFIEKERYSILNPESKRESDNGIDCYERH